MRKYARFGRELRKLTRQAKICTPPGGEVIAKICVLRSKDLYSRIDFATDGHICRQFFPLRRLAAAATFHIGNFVAAAIKIIGFLPSSSSSPSSSPCPSSLVSVGGPRLRKFALPTPRSGHWPTCENMCTGNLTRSGLRKYALRQNHTIPVWSHSPQHAPHTRVERRHLS